MRSRLAFASLLALLALGATASAQTPEYHPYPAGLAYAQGITAGEPGVLWFSGQATTGSPPPSLIRLDVASAAVNTSNGMQAFPTPELDNSPCCSKQMRALAYDATNGRVWWSQSGGYVGFGSPATMAPGTSDGMRILKTWGPNLSFTPWGIAVGKFGELWVAEYSADNTSGYPGDRLAKVTASDGDALGHEDDGLVIDQGPNVAMQGGASTIDSARYDAKPRGVAVDATGLPWFTEAAPGYPGYRLASWPGGSTYQEFLVAPCADSGPCSGSNTGNGLGDVTVAGDGSKWLTNAMKRTIVKYDGSTFTHYTLGSMDPAIAGGVPQEATTAPDGTLWFNVSNDFNQQAAIVKIDPTASPPTSTVFKLGTEKRPIDVAADSAGNVWFVTAPWGGGTSYLGRLRGVTGTTPGGGGSTDGGGGGGNGGGGQPATPPATAGTTPPPAAPVTKPLVAAAVGTAILTNPLIRNSSVNLNQQCVGPPEDRCSLVYLIQTHEYVQGFPGVTGFRANAAKKRKTRVVTVGTKSLTLKGGETAKVTISLNDKGRKLLKRFKRLPVRLTAKQLVPGGTPRTLKTAKLRFRAAK
jgi:streptogramin lyase